MIKHKKYSELLNKKLGTNKYKHTRYVSSIKIIPWKPPESVKSTQSKRTIQRHIKLYCKKDKHTYQYVRKYDIDHIQCEYCAHRKFKPGDDCSYFLKWHYDEKPLRMPKLFDNAFSTKKEAKNDV